MVAQSRQILDIRENLNQLTSCLSDLICFSTSDRFGFFSGIEVEVFAEGAVGTWNRLEPLGWFISVFMSGVSLTLNFFCGGTTDLSMDNDVRNSVLGNTLLEVVVVVLPILGSLLILY